VKGLEVTHRLEVPDSVYQALERAASASGTTPVGWISAKLGNDAAIELPRDARTASDLFAGRIGRIHSGGKYVLSENSGDRLVDSLSKWPVS
jgi:hypothetical protein